MRPASLFVIVVYAVVLFGGISDVNGGFLKDLLKFGKKGVDQAGEAIEEAESSSKPLLHDFQAHDPDFLRNQHPPPTVSEANRLAIMYPYDQEIFSEGQQQVWALMQQQEALQKELVTAYRESQRRFKSNDAQVRGDTMHSLQEHVDRLSSVYSQRKNLGLLIGPLDDMPQLVPAFESILSAWQILDARPSSQTAIISRGRDLYSLVVKIEQSLSTALEQHRVCDHLHEMLGREDRPSDILHLTWNHYEEESEELRQQAISLYARIDEVRGTSFEGIPTYLHDFLADRDFPKLEEVAKTRDVGREDWNKEWMTALSQVESKAADANRRLENLKAGRREFDDGPRGIRIIKLGERSLETHHS